MATTAKHDRRLREERLGFRVDEPTKALIERAAQLERRKLTDFCMTALSEARVALVMGSAFGAEGYARMSFATDMQTLERGFDSLSQFLRG